jgi:hypothetical protein
MGASGIISVQIVAVKARGRAEIGFKRLAQGRSEKSAKNFNQDA